jgi:hypothetical protein
MTIPTIGLCTLFRDSSFDVKRMLEERKKWDYPQDKLLHICMEGDSTDSTYDDLLGYKSSLRMIVEKHDCGRQKFGSVAEPERLQILAALWNKALDIAVAEGTDYICIVDSDISVAGSIMKRLLSHDKDVIAPMLFFEKSVYFRDTWAYRGINGECFQNRPPYHKDYKRTSLVPVNSVGFPLMKKEVVAAGARCDHNEVVGLCDKIRELGFLLFVDPLAITYHPRNGIEVPTPYEHR